MMSQTLRDSTSVPPSDSKTSHHSLSGEAAHSYIPKTGLPSSFSVPTFASYSYPSSCCEIRKARDVERLRSLMRMVKYFEESLRIQESLGRLLSKSETSEEEEEETKSGVQFEAGDHHGKSLEDLVLWKYSLADKWREEEKLILEWSSLAARRHGQTCNCAVLQPAGDVLSVEKLNDLRLALQSLSKTMLSIEPVCLSQEKNSGFSSAKEMLDASFKQHREARVFSFASHPKTDQRTSSIQLSNKGQFVETTNPTEDPRDASPDHLLPQPTGIPDIPARALMEEFGESAWNEEPVKAHSFWAQGVPSPDVPTNSSGPSESIRQHPSIGLSSRSHDSPTQSARKPSALAQHAAVLRFLESVDKDNIRLSISSDPMSIYSGAGGYLAGNADPSHGPKQYGSNEASAGPSSGYGKRDSGRIAFSKQSYSRTSVFSPILAEASGSFYQRSCYEERWDDTEEVLGEGGFAKVRVVLAKRGANSVFPEGFRAAMKVFCKDSRLFKIEHVAKELVAYRKLEEKGGGHPNIVKVFEVSEDVNHVFLVMEYLSGGQLLERIQNEGQYTEGKAASLARSMVSALDYCHQLNVTHRDIKPENFVFASMDNNSPIKIIDFGISHVCDDPDASMKTLLGTPTFVAPEVFLCQPYSNKADMWSLGVTLFIMLVGYPPFNENDLQELSDSIKYAPVRMDGPEWILVSDPAKDFVSALLRKDPNKRLSAKHALEHPWLCGSYDSECESALTIAQINIRSFIARTRWKALINAVQAGNRFQKFTVVRSLVIQSELKRGQAAVNVARRSTSAQSLLQQDGVSGGSQGDTGKHPGVHSPCEASDQSFSPNSIGQFSILRMTAKEQSFVVPKRSRSFDLAQAASVRSPDRHQSKPPRNAMVGSKSTNQVSDVEPEDSSRGLSRESKSAVAAKNSSNSTAGEKLAERFRVLSQTLSPTKHVKGKVSGEASTSEINSLASGSVGADASRSTSKRSETHEATSRGRKLLSKMKMKTLAEHGDKP